MTAHDVIKRPILSEKSLVGVENKKYVFEVDLHSTKLQIRAAVEELFDGAKVESVHTVRVSGKYKRQGKNSGYTSDYKKAIVQLTKKSKSITFFDSLN
ncbi:MAG: 50S ribosomal protein L23 [Clostridiales bacterium]|jgi:large subunit ribosomal protein L23|nr:50S ribosomal protein L23 [Clostridiales bacterium]